MPYHDQRVALFWRSTMMLQRSVSPLEPGTLSLVLLATNLKSILGQYRGIGPGLDRGRRMEKMMAARTL